ncbi:MAG: PilZ domain-containing protein [Planctomycetota bacterium]|jgi:c-di-GMP-binding flagellar brake protein YcgR
MVQKELLNSFEIKDMLTDACLKKSPVVASFTSEGKWRILELKIEGFTDDTINFSTETPCENLQKELPVGICIHLGHFKYLFDTTVQTMEIQGQSRQVLLDFPSKTERIQRRMYHRQPVPPDMKVKVLFWHRGYLDDANGKPEELYWQGRLLNLSAGGAQFEIEIEQKKHFKVGQLLGIQFTPMSYQKPLLLESHVKYLNEQSDDTYFRIGVELLGLEAGPEGREILTRLLEVIAEYEKMNQTISPKSTES